MGRICRGLCALMAAVLALPFLLPAAAQELPQTEPTAPAVVESAAPQTERQASPATTSETTKAPKSESPKPAEPEELETALPSETQDPTEETVPETVPEETEPAISWDVDTVPLYYQDDYPDTLYGNGTIATTGCSIVSLAMVATYMTGYEYRPDMLADYFGGYTGSNIDRLEYASDMLQLPWRKAENWHDTQRALQDGCVAIVLMNKKSAFTGSQHFMVLTGLTEDGKVLVNDPKRSNYDLWNLEDGFANGFSPAAICNGYSGGWVYDKSAMPDEPFIYEEEEVPFAEEPRYDFELTDEELNLLARLVWAEAQGEPVEGQQAVAEVVLNRLAADNFPDVLRTVIYADDQFASSPYLYKAKATQTQYEAIERALYGPYILPMDVVFFATYEVNDNVWGQIGEHIFCYQW